MAYGARHEKKAEENISWKRLQDCAHLALGLPWVPNNGVWLGRRDLNDVFRRIGNLYFGAAEAVAAHRVKMKMTHAINALEKYDSNAHAIDFSIEFDGI